MENQLRPHRELYRYPPEPRVALMGVLQRIGDAILGKRIVDPFFGRLELDRSEMLTRPGQPRSRKYFQYWQGRVQFDPTGSEIGVLLPANETGPTEDQREVFRELTARWSYMTALVADAVYPVYLEWFAEVPDQQALSVDEVFGSLDFAGLEIEHPTLYPNRKRYQDLELGFEVPAETGGHALVAHVKNWTVVQAAFE